MARKRILFLLAGAVLLLILSGLGWLILPRLNRGSLVMTAQTISPSGELRAAAGATLYLLDADMILLGMVKGNESSPLRERVYREHPNLGMVALVMDARRRAAYSLGAEIIPFMEDSRPLWEPHVLQVARTDAQGRAVFEHLKPGDYWLMGRTESVDGAAFWNQRLVVNRGENRITLDQNNALFMK